MRKFIQPEIVKVIIESSDILSVVSDYVQLKKKGANYWGLSPFSKERTPSFSVNPSKGIYKCFSSGKGGNAISFLMELEGFNYVEALQYLAQKYGIDIPEPSEKEDKSVLIESLHRVLNLANDFYNQNTDAVYAFCNERKIDLEVAKKFMIGHAPEGWSNLFSFLNGNSSVEIMKLAGLINFSDKTNSYYDIFRNRIMFPIQNSIGKIVGFGGRQINKNDSPKYLNTQETEVYQKNKLLYGLYHAKTAIRQNGFAFIVEGYMDTIMMHQYGYYNTVASAGTSITIEQIRLLRRFTKKVVLIYDGDAPGIKAADRAIDILISEGMEVFVICLPDGHDPDSFLSNYGSEGLENVLSSKLSFIDYKLKFGITDDSPIQKKKVIEDIAKSISHISDKMEAQLYAKQVSDKTGVDYSLIYELINTTEQPKSSIDLSFIDIALSNQNKATISEIEVTEKILLELILVYGNTQVSNIETNEIQNIADYVLGKIEPLTFFNQTYQTIRKEYEEKRHDVSYFYAHSDDRIKMVAMSLNCMKIRIENMMKEYDTFDQQSAWFDMIEKIVSTYIGEWHQVIFNQTLSKVTYRDSIDSYINTVLPLLNLANGKRSLKKYEL